MSTRDRGDREEEFRPRIGRRRRSDRERVPTLRVPIRGAFRSRVASNPEAGRQASARSNRRTSAACGEPAMRGQGAIRAAERARHEGGAAAPGVFGTGRCRARRGAGAALRRGRYFSAEEFRAPLENEPRQFRFIVSPEEGDRLDLKEFTRQFMRQVEKDTGRRLIWAAVNHHNTDNPHVHIVIRGVDRDGDELRIDGRYIGRGDAVAGAGNRHA